MKRCGPNRRLVLASRVMPERPMKVVRRPKPSASCEVRLAVCSYARDTALDEKCSNASARCCAVGKRCTRSAAIAVVQMSRSGAGASRATCSSGGQSARAARPTASAVEAASKGGLPESSRYNTAPSANTSVRASTTQGVCGVVTPKSALAALLRF
jgi:hypothetical protein